MNPPDVAIPLPLIPFLAACVVGSVPSWRVGGWINCAASGLTFLLACALPWSVGETGTVLRVDALAAHGALLTAFVGGIASWSSLGTTAAELASGRLDRSRLRLYHAMFQCMIGGLLLALLSNDLVLTGVAFGAAVVAATVAVGVARTAGALGAAWRLLLVCGLGVLLALMGSVLLVNAAPPVLGAVSWTSLAAEASRCDGAMLSLAFVFLLIGYGTLGGLAPLHAWVPEVLEQGPAPVASVLAGAGMNVALVVILRLRDVMAANVVAIAPGPPLLALGLFSLVLTAFSLWRSGDLRRFLGIAAIGQSGIAAFAFGLGGPVATFAGLLQLTLFGLIAVALVPNADLAARLSGHPVAGLLGAFRGLGLTLAAGLLALAALPPFGLFTSEFLIVSETIRQAPLLAVPLAIGLVVVGWSMVARLQSVCLGGPPPAHRPSPSLLALAPAWLPLALVVILGLAMPEPVARWMSAIAASVR